VSFSTQINSSITSESLKNSELIQSEDLIIKPNNSSSDIRAESHKQILADHQKKTYSISSIREVGERLRLSGQLDRTNTSLDYIALDHWPISMTKREVKGKKNKAKGSKEKFRRNTGVVPTTQSSRASDPALILEESKKIPLLLTETETETEIPSLVTDTVSDAHSQYTDYTLSSISSSAETNVCAFPIAACEAESSDKVTSGGTETEAEIDFSNNNDLHDWSQGLMKGIAVALGDDCIIAKHE